MKKKKCLIIWPQFLSMREIPENLIYWIGHYSLAIFNGKTWSTG